MRKIDKKITLSQKAFHALKNMIVTSELKPGERLDEKKLSSMLSLSRTPIRESLFRLQAENLVDYHNHSGIYVKDLSFKSVKDYFEALLPIEITIAQIAPLRISTKELKSLEEINQRTNKAIDKRNYLEITTQNSLFHRHIAQTTNNTHLFAFIERLQNEGQRLAFLCYSKEVSLDKTLARHFQEVKEQHEKIITDLRKRDVESMKKTAVKHVQLFQSRITKYLTQTF